VALAAAATGAGVARAQFAGPVADEALQHAVLDQHRALRFHALVVHRQRAEGAAGEALIDGGDGGVSDRLAHLLGEGCGAALHLGGFQQVAAGFVEDHAAEAVGQHNRQLSRLHIVGIEHGAGAFAHFGR
jgi:hypothetical protein